MNILIIDGQGGKLGRQLTESVLKKFTDVSVTCVGTNGAATAAMIKGGAVNAATGENAVAVCCRNADIIVGPIGIVLANSMLGEITPKMAEAVADSSAVRILLPANRCATLIAGVKNITVTDMINDALEKIAGVIEQVR